MASLENILAELVNGLANCQLFEYCCCSAVCCVQEKKKKRPSGS